MKKMEKKRKSMNIINSELPPEILSQIVSKLPWSNLLTCRLVCKAWNTCISSFMSESKSKLLIAQMSRNHLQCVDLDPKHLKGMDIIGSLKLHPKWSDTEIANTCNGLLCILNVRTKRRDRVAILNPMTYEYMKLPRGDEDRMYLYGLGFSPKTRQYKIARQSLKNGKALVEILGFGTKVIRWRRIVRFKTRVCMNPHHQGTYFNGAIYWVGGDGKGYAIWRLKVEDEKFEEHWLPKVGVDGVEMTKYSGCCGVFNGSLYVSHYAMPGFEYHVWKMDEEGLWERAFVVNLPPKFYECWAMIESYHFQLIKLCGDGKMLCLLHSFLLVLYDPKTGKLEKIDHVKEEIKRSFRIYHIDSIHFQSLPNILAGDGDAAAA